MNAHANPRWRAEIGFVATGLGYSYLQHALHELGVAGQVPIGAKSAEMAPVAEAERVTGYRVGGVSPLGQKKRLPTVVDAAAAALPQAFVNGGQRGLQARLAPADLVRVLGAIVAEVKA